MVMLVHNNNYINLNDKVGRRQFQSEDEQQKSF